MRLRPLLAKHRLRLADGMKVRIFGHLDFYAPSGQLGLKMADLDPRFTLGDLAQQRDQVLRRLAADGSLDANGRRPLSPVPLRVGVVVQRRHRGVARLPRRAACAAASASSSCSPTRGSRARGAAARSAGRSSALSHHADRRGLDAIVVIRGGGARNELATFDAEPIARAIAAAPVPVLTGLGHEIDRSVADEVAHTSLKTPTACAAALVQAVGALPRRRVEQRYDAVVARRRAPARPRPTAALADRAHRIARRTHAAVERADERLGVRGSTGSRAGARRPLDDGERRLRAAPAAWPARVPQLLAAEERHLAGIEARVRALDPVNVLARGWSITRAADGRVVRSPDDVAAGDVLTTQLAAGSLRSRVEPDARDTP